MDVAPNKVIRARLRTEGLQSAEPPTTGEPSSDAGYPVELARLVAATRELVIAVGLTEVADTDLQRATAAVADLTAALQAKKRDRVLRMPEPDPSESTHHTGEPVSGSLNPFAPPVPMRIDGASITATVRLSPILEGPAGSVHGGYLAMMIDSVMGQLVHGNDIRAVTGTLSLRYRNRTPIDEELTLTARLRERTGRKILVTATVASGDLVTVTAEGIFVTV